MPERPQAIDWLEWDRSAFDRARRSDRPVLLALVAPWCEHCARMDRTTYARPDVARAVRERFVAIRVNADRRPDVTDRYNLGGWPTTTFLTPEGVAFGGGTFIEPDRMLEVLGRVTDAFVRRRTEIEALVLERVVPRDVLPPPREASGRDDESVQWLSSELFARFDAEWGGFGRRAKFPHVPALTLLLERFADTGDAAAARMVSASLDGIAGLVDETNGGFFRYASNRDWSGRRTEKLLRENAQLVRAHLEAGRVLGRSDYHDRAMRALDWARRTLARSGGGFGASQAAGAAYYDAAAASRPPAVDATQYADANAEMVVALLRAAQITGDGDLCAGALAALEHVVLTGYHPGRGVSHVVGAEPDVCGLLTDQLGVIEALLMAQLATGRLSYSMLAVELMEYAIGGMWDQTGGGFRDRADGAPDTAWLPAARPFRPFAANCTAARLLDRLAVVTGRIAYRDRAKHVLERLAASYRDDPLLGACYGLAVREVCRGRRPDGWALARVDWGLAEH